MHDRRPLRLKGGSPLPFLSVRLPAEAVWKRAARRALMISRRKTVTWDVLLARLGAPQLTRKRGRSTAGSPHQATFGSGRDRFKHTAAVRPPGWRVSGNRLQSAEANREEFLNSCLTLFILFKDREVLHLFRA